MGSPSLHACRGTDEVRWDARATWAARWAFAANQANSLRQLRQLKQSWETHDKAGRSHNLGKQRWWWCGG